MKNFISGLHRPSVFKVESKLFFEFLQVWIFLNHEVILILTGVKLLSFFLLLYCLGQLNQIVPQLLS